MQAVAAGYFGPQTQLKYAVEFIIPRTTGMLGVVEPLLERVVFEDVPANLGAVKHRVEALLKERRLAALEEGGNSERAAAMRKKLLRPRLADMVDDFSILAAELERCFGKEGSLPTRNMLRDMNRYGGITLTWCPWGRSVFSGFRFSALTLDVFPRRTDLEKAIAAHGGPTAVAESLGWKVKGKSRKPRGYWDALPNVKQEVDDFIEEYGMQPGENIRKVHACICMHDSWPPLLLCAVHLLTSACSIFASGMMPLKNDFIRAGRFDLARAVERWGGLYELAAELDYEVASPVFSGTEWQEHISEVAASTGLSGKQGLFELAARTYRRNSDEEQGESAAGRTSRSRSMGRERKRAYAEMPSVRSEIDGW